MSWKELRHATGPATRVPDQIKQLAGKDRCAREQAYLDLIDAFARVGEWFTASPHALDALLDAVARADAPELVLAVAADVIAGDHVRAWAAPTTEVSPAAAADTRRVAEERVAELLALLDARKPGARAGATLVLALLPEAREASRAAILARLAAERDPVVRAGMILALARIGEHDEASRRAVLHARRDANPLVRGAAATAALRMEPSAPLHSEHERLGDALAWDAPTPWFRGVVLGFEEESAFAPPLAAALLEIARRRDTMGALLDELVAVAQAAEPGLVTRCIGDTMTHAGELAVDRSLVATIDELTVPQRAVAERVATTWLLPDGGDGLPAAGRARARWAGKAEPGPLDAVVTIEIEGTILVGPRWRAWRELRKRGLSGSAEVPPIVAAGLAPLDRFEALVEFMAETYRWSVGLRTEDIESELRRVSGEEQLFDRVRIIADDLAARFAVAHDERRLHISPMPDLGMLLFLPFVRARRPLRPEWDSVIYLGPTEVFESLPEARREAMLVRRVRLDHDASLDRALDQAIYVLPLVPTKGAVDHLLLALAVAEKKKHVAAKRLRAKLQATAASNPKLAKLIGGRRR